MQPSTLAFLALIAPLPATAASVLDCISIESCGNGGCGPETSAFTIFFDENDVATINVDDTAVSLSLRMRGESHDPTLMAVSEFGDLGVDNYLLRLETEASKITAYYTFENPLAETWVANCSQGSAP